MSIPTDAAVLPTKGLKNAAVARLIRLWNVILWPLLPIVALMYEAVLDQLKQQVADVLVAERQFEPTEAGQTADAAGRTLAEIVKQQIRANDFSVINEALSGLVTNPDHPAIQNLTAPLAAGIASRTGMDVTKATGAASVLLPLAFNMFNEQVQQAKSKGIDPLALVQQLASGGLSFANMGAAMTLANSFMKSKSGKSGVGGMLSKFF